MREIVAQRQIFNSDVNVGEKIHTFYEGIYDGEMMGWKQDGTKNNRRQRHNMIYHPAPWIRTNHGFLLNTYSAYHL